jgi:hypothetical protein
MDVDLDGATWRKSTYSNGSGGECVEVANLPNGRAVRDSKHPEGPILVFTRDEWRAFVQGIHAGELHAELQPGRAADLCCEDPGHDLSFVMGPRTGTPRRAPSEADRAANHWGENARTARSAAMRVACRFIPGLNARGFPAHVR